MHGRRGSVCRTVLSAGSRRFVWCCFFHLVQERFPRLLWPCKDGEHNTVSYRVLQTIQKIEKMHKGNSRAQHTISQSSQPPSAPESFGAGQCPSLTHRRTAVQGPLVLVMRRFPHILRPRPRTSWFGIGDCRALVCGKGTWRAGGGVRPCLGCRRDL